MSHHEEGGHSEEKGMSNADIIKIIINLVVIYAVGGSILAGVYAWASPKMFIEAKKAKEKALKEMMPEADEAPKKIGDWSPHDKHAEYYEVKKGGQRIGYIVETYGKGYSSFINTLVSLDANLVVQKINVLHHAETPGLGDEVEVPAWKDQFKGKSLDQLVLVKDGPGIQAVSGATISSRAVSGDKNKGIVGVQGGVQMLTDALAGKKPAASGHEGGHH